MSNLTSNISISITHGGHLLAHFCNGDGSQSIDKYVHNVTASYADTSKESSMASASIIMFVIAGLFFDLSLLSSVSNASSFLNPTFRFVLSGAVSQVLPVMSYLFSEAKNAGSGSKPDLSLQAGMILLWMLLVELLRKKVDVIRMTGYSGTIQRAGRVVWLGNLVFFNIGKVGRKAVFGVLWVVCATKVLQRIVFTEVGKRSYAYSNGKNSRLIDTYMSQNLQQRRPQSPDEDQEYEVEHRATEGEALLNRCKFIVMGEEDLVIEPTVRGYKLKDVISDDAVLTVGKVWHTLDSRSGFTQLNRLKRLCLSLALSKLLRRRFEHLPHVSEEETHECCDLLFKGFYNGTEDSAATLLQMINDEVNFLCEYYHSIIPVVLAGPFFFISNYLLLPMVVLALCVMTVILCGDGNAHFALASIRNDYFTISSDVVKTTMCLVIKAIYSPLAFYTMVDFCTTFLLFAIFFYEEIWEFNGFLLSNWFMVSLMHNYVTKPWWRHSKMFKIFIRRIIWVQGKLSQPVPNFKQFSLLSLRWPLILGVPSMFSLVLRTAPVPNKAKHSIVESLVTHIRHGSDLNNGSSVLINRRDLWPACRSEIIAEVILTWHVATTILEAECTPDKGKHGKASHYHTVATRLSKYCAYLVAFHPELLPDNQDKTELVFEAAMADLQRRLGCARYYLSSWRTRVCMVLEMTTRSMEWKDGEVVHNGSNLGRMLREQVRGDNRQMEEETWKLVADVWTEIVMYLAPSGDDGRIFGHESVLEQGGEFITVLWALTTHTGINRPEYC
ncbi:hypothetical protein ZWY2020_010451 [Hordeum vulgare]|nr:hypothetical protein ZWY2020_010451 [Hordeum vulgare]